MEVERLPEVLRPRAELTDRLLTATRADVVAIGKFDVEREVRLRAFYERTGLSLRYQSGGPKSGIARTLSAHEHVVRHAPGLMPQIFEDGRVRGGQYLIEESLFGRHPRAGKELQSIAGEVASGLRRLYEGYGIADVRLSKVLGPKFPKRWEKAARDHSISDQLADQIRSLVSRDQLVEVSYGHGDLVGTNIMMLPDRGFVLIDWEYAGELPIAFDVAKIHLHCSQPVEAARTLQVALGRPERGGASHYTFRQQIALAHARYIAWSGPAMQRAKIANRETQLRRLISKRRSVIESLLEGS
mgnify:FL=1